MPKAGNDEEGGQVHDRKVGVGRHLQGSGPSINVGAAHRHIDYHACLIAIGDITDTRSQQSDDRWDEVLGLERGDGGGCAGIDKG